MNNSAIYNELGICEKVYNFGEEILKNLEQRFKEIDEIADKMRTEILSTETDVVVFGTEYYVSADGNDSADGKSPETAWKTLGKASSATLSEGDVVYFRRGDIFRGQLVSQTGVTYSAYGEGEKP